MRLWSLHPSLLDTKGLVAVWREGLLARKVLRGLTRGYRHHPQLERFREARKPLEAIDCYLSRVLDEAHVRGYSFDRAKIRYRRCRGHANVASGQVELEWAHLLAKVSARAPEWRAALCSREAAPHPCFRVTPGPVAQWERAR